MFLVLMKFTDYATQSGCLLLQEDITYLRKYVLKVPLNERTDVLRRYIGVWVAEMQGFENEVQAQNVGRRCANIWLRGLLGGN
jgi:hypothetical protein